MKIMILQRNMIFVIILQFLHFGSKGGPLGLFKITFLGHYWLKCKPQCLYYSLKNFQLIC